MQDIDLGDRSGLIDLIYGPPTKEAVSATNSVNTPLTAVAQNEQNSKNEKQQKQQKKKSVVTCSFCSAFLLFLLVAAAIFLSGFIAYWVTKQDYEKKLSIISNFMPMERRNLSALGEVQYEEEEPPAGPTAEELKLPGDFAPVWYNLSTKIYLPGFSPPSKESTTENHVLIKMRTISESDKIVLNSGEFVFPDLDKIQILVEKPNLRLRRQEPTNTTELPAENSSETALVDDMATDENSTEASAEFSEEITERTTTTTTEMTIAVEISPMYKDSGIAVKSLNYNKTLEKVTLELSEPIAAGREVILKLPFTGKLSTSMNGLYLSKYKVDAEEKYLVATHMEPSYARNMVPSFDEPQLKAPWKISVIHPNATVARGNGDVEDEEESEPGWQRTVFHETGPISSYLTALVVSDFAYTESQTKSGCTVRVWSRPDMINSTNYALNIAVKAIEELEKFYDVEIPYKKQDLFALPDFSPGAMENPGLILFRESLLLYDPQFDDVSQKIDIAQTVCHEISHQWFGNLVTLSGWDSLWLNEAFATYMEFYTMDKVLNSPFSKDEYELVTSVEQAFVDDARSSSHPLTSKIAIGTDALELFDTITYDKGASVVRMITKIIGEEPFQKGIQKYIKTYSDSNANYSQLWSSLQTAVPPQLTSYDGNPFDLPQFANNWILQMGYPVVEIYRIDKNTVELTQRRFKIDNLTPELSRYRDARFWYKWDIPLFLNINGEDKPMKWLHEATRIPLNITDTLLINTNSFGYYRVNYDEAGWNMIAEQLQTDHTKFTPLARARFLSDALALAAANELPYETALNLTKYLAKETEYAPIVVAIRGLDEIYDRIKLTETGRPMKKYIINLLSDMYNNIDLASLSTEDEAMFLKLKKQIAVNDLYCEITPKKCKKLMAGLALGILNKCHGQQYSSICTKVPVPLKTSVYCDSVYRDDDVFDTFLKFAKNEVVATEREALIKALGCSRSPIQLMNLLRDAFLTNSSSIPRNELPLLMDSITSHEIGNFLTTNFILDNWAELHKNLNSDWDVLSRVLNNGLSARSRREIAQLEQFVAEHRSTAKPFTAFRKRLETGRSNVRLLKQAKSSIADFLKQSN